LFNEVLILQTLSIICLLFFIQSFNILTVWYLAGIYLFLLGWWLFLDDGDIFVGFLWVIDLGVGLIFFIFILHYSTFLHQKSGVRKTSREVSFSVFGFFALASTLQFISERSEIPTVLQLNLTWFFDISWYDYHDFTDTNTITDLNLLHEIYFTNNCFEFFLINFFLFYGIIGSISLTFLIKRVFSLMNYDQLTNKHIIKRARSTYFIRSQDYLKQQFTSAGTRTWSQKKTTRV
jgi:hypothetical protein